MMQRDENGFIEPTACGTVRDDEGGGYHWAVYNRSQLLAEAGGAEYDALADAVPYRAYYSHAGGAFRSEPSFRCGRTRILVKQRFGLDI